MLRAISHAHYTPAEPFGTIVLDSHDRHMRRKVITDRGDKVMADLPEAVLFSDGDWCWRMAARSRSSLHARRHLKILLLTSEFSPAMGGIGTYVREIATAATNLGAEITVVAPDYARDLSSDDRALPFEVRRFRGGLHSMRDLPAKIRLTHHQVAAYSYDIVHAADWPFFIPVALSRRRPSARSSSRCTAPRSMKLRRA